MSSYLKNKKKKAHRKLTKEGNVKCPLNEPHHYSPFYFHPSQFFISPLCFCWTLLAIISSFAVLLLLFFHPCLDLFVVLFSLDCFVIGQHSDREKKEKHSWLPLRKTGNQDNPLLSGRISGLRLKERFNLQHVDWPRQKATMRKTLEQCVKTLTDLFFNTKSLYFI